jgi:hypothetical protein
MDPRWGSIPRLTDWLTVSRNVTLTLTWHRECQEWPCWLVAGCKLLLCSAAYTKDRPVFSLERAPHKNDRYCQTEINIWSWAADGARHQDLLTDWPSVAIWLRLWHRDSTPTRTPTPVGSRMFSSPRFPKVNCSTQLDNYILITPDMVTAFNEMQWAYTYNYAVLPIM